MKCMTDAERLIADLQNIGVQAVIAGGYCRDTILGGPIRDIDLYIDHGHWYAARTYLFDTAGEFPVCTSFIQGDPEYDHQYIYNQFEHAAGTFCIAKYTDMRLHERPINLIGVKAAAYAGGITGVSITSLFNLTTSQCWVDGNGYGQSAAFNTLLPHKVLKVTRAGWGRDGTGSCIIKFLTKYPDWRVACDGKIYEGKKDIDRWLIDWMQQE
jgi:hypothetical protein